MKDESLKTLSLQQFLTYHQISELKDYGVKLCSHPEYPELCHLSINKAAPATFMEYQFVRECRGSIINPPTNKFACRPSDQFFNYGETYEPLDLDVTIKVQVKYDVSLVNVWRYKNVFNISTTGSPDASDTVGNLPLTFSRSFWDTLKSCEFDLVDLMDVREYFTYSFELQTPLNQIGVSHESPVLTLLSIRNNFTAEETIPRLNSIPAGCQLRINQVD